MFKDKFNSKTFRDLFHILSPNQTYHNLLIYHNPICSEQPVPLMHHGVNVRDKSRSGIWGHLQKNPKFGEFFRAYQEIRGR